MGNISNNIEQYLKSILAANGSTYIDVSRNQVAAKFRCVPSQVNYVINTRFTPDQGFLIQSKRGGGGYIRIIKVKIHSRGEFLQDLEQLVSTHISQQVAENLLIRLTEQNIITPREEKIMKNIINRNVLAFSDYVLRDKLRAQIMKSLLNSLTYDN